MNGLTIKVFELASIISFVFCGIFFLVSRKKGVLCLFAGISFYLLSVFVDKFRVVIQTKNAPEAQRYDNYTNSKNVSHFESPPQSKPGKQPSKKMIQPRKVIQPKTIVDTHIQQPPNMSDNYQGSLTFDGIKFDGLGGKKSVTIKVERPDYKVILRNHSKISRVGTGIESNAPNTHIIIDNSEITDAVTAIKNYTPILSSQTSARATRPK